MATLARLLVLLGLDSAEYDKGLDDAEKKAQTKAKNIGSELGKIGSSLSNLGKTMSLAVTAPIVVGFGASIKAASDMNESISKSNAVFGDFAGQVQAFSSKAATSLAMTSQQALEATASYGNLFVSMGMGQGPAAEMSTALTQLAADMGSFNNIPMALMLEKIRSGMVGQAEPLLALGANLGAAEVNAKAMAMGLADASGQLSNSAVLQARFALLMEQTKIQQGDLAKTSGGLANSTKILGAQIGDLAIKIGQLLLPIAQQLVGLIQQVVGWFSSLSPEMQKTVVILAAVAAAIGPLLVIIGSLISSIGAIIPIVTAVAGVISFPLIMIIGAVIGAIALLVAAWTSNWGGIRDTVMTVITAISTFISSAWETIKAVFAAAVAFIQPLINAFMAALRGDWYAFGENLRLYWDNAWNLIKSILSGAWTAIVGIVGNLITNVINFFTTTNWGEVGLSIIRGIANGIASGASAIANAALSAARAALAAAKGFLGIHSPSTVFAGIGRNMMLGMALGIDESAKIPARTVNLAVSGTLPNAAGGSGGSDNSEMVALLQQISGKPGLDEYRLSKMIRDAVLQAAR